MKWISPDGVRRALEPALRRVLHFYWRFARGLTLGVRALVIDDKGRIFLVKHSYVARLAPAGRRGGGRRDAGRSAHTRVARGRQYRADRAAALARHVLQRPRFPARPCRAVRRARVPPDQRRRCPTTRSWRTASSPSTSFPTTPPPARARASSRCSAAPRSANVGEIRSVSTCLRARRIRVSISSVRESAVDDCDSASRDRRRSELCDDARSSLACMTGNDSFAAALSDAPVPGFRCLSVHGSLT